ncbi:MAG: discoidin domain-containing protein, partial [Protaetiibacter sp.]
MSSIDHGELAARGLRRPRLAIAALAGFAALVLAAVSLATATGAQAAQNVLLSRGALTAASSSEGAGVGPRFAVDGDRGTRWASQWSDAQWFRVDLGESHPIERVVIDWEAAYAKAFTIAVSDDGASWSTVATVTDGTGGLQELEMIAAGRYVQFTGTERATGYGYSFHEFEVYGDGDPVDPTDPPVWNDEVTHHEFQANCTFSHILPDDPIVFPGQPGASHSHTFVGNTSTNAFSTPETLLASGDSTCTVPQDDSSYWFPTLFR